VIQWESTGKKEIVDITDLKKYSPMDSNSRKRKAPDYYNSEISVGKTKKKTDGSKGEEIGQDQVIRNNFFFRLRIVQSFVLKEQ
jgi:hypothetical protein